MWLTIDFCCKLNCPLGTLKLSSIMSKLQANVASVNLCKSGNPKQPCSRWTQPPATHLHKIRLTSILFMWYVENKSLVLCANLWTFRHWLLYNVLLTPNTFLHCEGAIVPSAAAAPQFYTHRTAHPLRQTHQHHICTPNPLKSAHFQKANRPGSCLAMLLRPQALLAHITWPCLCSHIHTYTYAGP